VATENMGK